MMFNSERGSVIFKILVIVGFVVFFLLVSLPSIIDTHKDEKKEECIENQRLIHQAITELVLKTKRNFEGTLNDLKEKGYLSAILDCPESPEAGTAYGEAREVVLEKKNKDTGDMEVIIDPETNKPMTKIERIVYGYYSRTDTTESVQVVVSCPNEKDFPEHVYKVEQPLAPVEEAVEEETAAE